MDWYFIICSYEHVIANACYFTYAKEFSGKVVLYFVIMAVGNSIGAIIVQLTRNYLRKLKEEKASQN